MPTVKTRYGLVDREGLEKLRDEFDTMKILAALDTVDRVRGEIDNMRWKLLHLHGVMHDLVNGAPNPTAESHDPFELSEEIDDVAGMMDEVVSQVFEVTEAVTLLGSDDVTYERDGC